MVFKHKVGKHNSSFRFPKIFIGNSLSFTANIKNGHYSLNNVDKYDWNKLYGFSIGLDHHKDSIRIGWRAINEKYYEICLYIYKDGILHKYEEKQYISTLKFNTTYKFSLLLEHHSIILRIKNTEGHMDRYLKINFNDKFKQSLFKYTLRPFFGGNNPSPKNFEIEIKHI